MNLISDNRNGTAVFAGRVQKNLEFIALAAVQGHDVHPVTQAVSSLLGIIVFPWEHSAFSVVKRKKLPVLAAERGWPRWTMSGIKRVLEVGELVHVLRNCVAHGRIQFDSDSRNPTEVTITFVHLAKGKTEADWEGQIRADHLITFCRCFSAEMKANVD